MRGEAEATHCFKLPRTAFFLIVSFEHPRLDAGMLFQPLGHCFHHRAPIDIEHADCRSPLPVRAHSAPTGCTCHSISDAFPDRRSHSKSQKFCRFGQNSAFVLKYCAFTLAPAAYLAALLRRASTAASTFSKGCSGLGAGCSRPWRSIRKIAG